MSPIPSRPWQPTKLGLADRFIQAAKRAGAGAIPASIVYFLVRAMIRIFQDTDASLLTQLLAPTGLFFLIVWIVLFAFFLIATSRSWSDRAFTFSGFAATFFGLAVLGVFFFQLTGEVVEWFHHTPELVQRQQAVNEEALQNLADLKKQQAELVEELAEREKDRRESLAEAETDEQKKKVNVRFDRSIARLKGDLEKTQAEGKIIAERSMRPDSSKFGIVAYFLTNGPSNLPQDSGIAPALLGSIWLGLITILFAVPIGVGAALYLEEYRSEGVLAKIIQININNLAGVPSVVFGILGGFVFVYIFKQLQEAHPEIAARNLLGGGLTLGLLTLPMIIVSAQEAIRAVPISLRQGAYALGATKWQVMWTIVLPMARPGILTGTILALSRAIGEAAPLVLFGAQLFVDQNPSLFSRFTALPLQIFNWTDRPAYTPPGGDVAVDIWKYNAAIASTVLLVILLSMNAIAIIVRNRAQKKMRY